MCCCFKFQPVFANVTVRDEHFKTKRHKKRLAIPSCNFHVIAFGFVSIFFFLISNKVLCLLWIELESRLVRRSECCWVKNERICLLQCQDKFYVEFFIVLNTFQSICFLFLLRRYQVGTLLNCSILKPLMKANSFDFFHISMLHDFCNLDQPIADQWCSSKQNLLMPSTNGLKCKKRMLAVCIS